MSTRSVLAYAGPVLTNSARLGAEPPQDWTSVLEEALDKVEAAESRQGERKKRRREVRQEGRQVVGYAQEEGDRPSSPFQKEAGVCERKEKTSSESKVGKEERKDRRRRS